MKKIFLTLFVAIIFHASIFSQYRKGLFYLDANCNYSDKSDLSSGLGTEDVKSVFAPNFGYFVAKNFVVGVGLRVDYRDQSETVQGMAAYLNNVLYENMHTKNGITRTGLAPVVFAKYIYPVTKAWSISLMINSYKGWQNQKAYQNLKNTVNGSVTSSVLQTDSALYKGFTITPEIRYLFTDRFGVQLNFNGFSMSDNPVMNPAAATGSANSSMYQSDTKSNPHQYVKSSSINFNPSNWSLGLFVVLGKINNHARLTF